METYEVLERALRLIERPENWCQEIEHRGPALCAGWALIRIHDVEVAPLTLAAEALDRAAGGFPGSFDFVTFNDTHPHAEVVALFQEAIRNEKARAGVAIEAAREKVVV